MKFSLYASVAAFAMTASLAQAEAHLPFAKGEGDFNWESLDAFAAEHDLNGEEISIFGPWRGDDQGLVESIIDYFEEATGAEVSYAISRVAVDCFGGSGGTSLHGVVATCRILVRAECARRMPCHSACHHARPTARRA